MIPEIFEGLKGFDTTKKLNSEDVKFYDSLELNENATKFTGGAIFTLILLIILILFVLISSFIVLKKD